MYRKTNTLNFSMANKDLSFAEINAQHKARKGRDLMLMLPFAELVQLLAGDEKTRAMVWVKMYRLCCELGYITDPAIPEHKLPPLDISPELEAAYEACHQQYLKDLAKA